MQYTLLIASAMAIAIGFSACGQSPDSAVTADGQAAIGRVMIIGMDGTRSDGIQQANTPNLDALIAEGAVDYNAITNDISFSGPGWASMLTGVWCDKHGVIDNDASWAVSAFDSYPHLVARLKAQRPEAVAVSVSHWNPINDEILCADERDDNCGGADSVENVDTDLAVRDAVVDALQNQADLDFVFMQFDDIDHAGHGDISDGGSDPGGFCPYNNLAIGDTDGACNSFNYNPNYIASIETTDAYIGEIINALKSRPNYSSENWLVLVSPDHGGGGFIFNQHGHFGAQDRRTFFIASGEAVSEFPAGAQIKIVDIAATALHHLGVTINPDWQLDGQPVAVKTAGEYNDNPTPNCYTGGVDAGR